MNDMYEPCPPKRPSLRASNTRVTLTNTQSSLDAKVVIMGSAGVGKTSLVTRYVEERFAPQTTTTTGAFFHSKKVTVDGTKVRLQIWDTAGQERFRSMPADAWRPAPMYYRGASAAILVYDITNASSFDDVKVWIEELKRNCDPDLLIYIVGAKADLAAHGQRVVTSERARLALHTWFPPPPPPPSASTASTAPGTPKTEGVYDMYIRPRLPSLASTRSVPFMFSSATLGAIGTVTTGRLGSPGGKRRLGHAHSQSYSFATRLEDEGYGGEELVYPSEERGRVRRRARSSGRELEVAAAEFARSGASGWASRRGRSFEDVLMEDEDEEQSWGLSKGMELREVSAKDDRGIQNLFNAIIGQIIKRKDVLERERAARERDSITLGTNSLLEPSWGGIADKEEATLARRGKWSCCAV
ncbi:Ras-like GTP-binding protein RYL2 [Ceratobasidium sp. AG-Ba]|nr:Ras-like GTP-binding protein RYL2 [Ceratobasidium sp. AG-Ba]